MHSDSGQAPRHGRATDMWTLGGTGSMGSRNGSKLVGGLEHDFYDFPYGYGSIPINTIFRGMNIHLPAILM